MGELDTSLSTAKNWIDQFDGIYYSRTLRLIGALYSAKGEFERAQDYYRKCLKLEEKAGNNSEISRTLNHIGFTYRQMGEFEKALKCFKRGTDLAKKMGNDTVIVFPLANQVLVNLDLQNLDKAKIIFEDLILLNQKNIFVKFFRRICNALILKSSNRMKTKMKAQEILEELVYEKELIPDATPVVISHYIEYLIIEFQIYGEVKALEETMTLITKLEKLAKKKQSHFLFTAVLTLKAKLTLLQGNITEASNLFDQALNEAENGGMGELLRQIIHEKEQLDNNLEKWINLSKSSSPLFDKIENLKILDYIKKVQNLSM